MEEVFLWLQRTMLGMVDDEEEVFVELGRKLLTVHKYVVVNATTEAELSRAFWQEAAALAKHGVTAAVEKEKKDAQRAADQAEREAAEQEAKAAEEKIKTGGAEGAGASAEEAGAGEGMRADKVEQATEEEGGEDVEDVLKASGLGGGDNPKEDSVLLALPGFRFKVRAWRKVTKVYSRQKKMLNSSGVVNFEFFGDVGGCPEVKACSQEPLLRCLNSGAEFDRLSGGPTFTWRYWRRSGVRGQKIYVHVFPLRPYGGYAAVIRQR